MNVSQMMTQKEKAIKGLTGGIEGLFKKNKVRPIRAVHPDYFPLIFSVHPSRSITLKAGAVWHPPTKWRST